MAASRKWLFKKNLRARAFGWRGSKLAISRLKEAASEIRSAAKSDPVAAGEGTVSLMERIWPAEVRSRTWPLLEQRLGAELMAKLKADVN